MLQSMNRWVAAELVRQWIVCFEDLKVVWIPIMGYRATKWSGGVSGIFYALAEMESAPSVQLLSGVRLRLRKN